MIWKTGFYCANTSSNGLVGKLLWTGRPDIKNQFETLMKGECIKVPIDEHIIFNQLDENPAAIWSWLDIAEIELSILLFYYNSKIMTFPVK